MELANLAVSSGLLNLSWDANCSAYRAQTPDPLRVQTKIVNQSNCTVVAFVTWPVCTEEDLLQEGGRELVSSETLKENDFHHFDFLCSEGNPSFSIHRAAVDLFKLFLNHLRDLKAQLLDQNNGKLLRDTPLIITGHSLGGSIACLFNLWLLDSIPLTSSKLPLCITFGSPLVGDQGFQQAVSDYSRWHSCFLHVASNQDPVPRLFNPPDDLHAMSSSQISSYYKPFGTFLLCSEFGYACIEDPKAVSRLLEWSRSRFSNVGMQNVNYGSLLEQMKSLVYYKGSSQLGIPVTGSLQAGLVILLAAVGIPMTQDQQQTNSKILKDLEECETTAGKKVALDPSRKLSAVIKKKMAYLEWYKKKCKGDGIGYYDSYKNRLHEMDHDVTTLKKFLVGYWETTSFDSSKKPQKEGAHVRTAWLYGGTNYRRMVEPLVIAEYYRKGDKRDYENQGRSEHFKLLEKWLKEDPEKNEGALTEKKKKNVAGILTEDSLFWARVEEALICCELLKHAASIAAAEREVPMQYLQKFEAHVMGEINNYALSPEVFLRQSSFMRWWREFQGIGEASSYNYNPHLLHFMQNAKYEQYGVGEF